MILKTPFEIEPAELEQKVILDYVNIESYDLLVGHKMADRAKIGNQAKEEKTFIKGLSFIGAHAMESKPTAVDVRDGKIIRIRPLEG